MLKRKKRRESSTERVNILHIEEKKRKKNSRRDNVDNSMTVARFNFVNLFPVGLGSYAITKKLSSFFYQTNSEVRKETLDHDGDSWLGNYSILGSWLPFYFFLIQFERKHSSNYVHRIIYKTIGKEKQKRTFEEDKKWTKRRKNLDWFEWYEA